MIVANASITCTIKISSFSPKTSVSQNHSLVTTLRKRNSFKVRNSQSQEATEVTSVDDSWLDGIYTTFVDHCVSRISSFEDLEPYPMQVYNG